MTCVILYIAAGLSGLWGVGHLLATKGVVAGFGDLSTDNRRILTMEWISEGLALISIAAFVTVATVVDATSSVSLAVYGVAIGTLLVMAGVSLFTGFRVAFLPYRMCPFIFTGSALLIAWGAYL